MKTLICVMIFVFSYSATAGGWQSIGDIEYLGKTSKTIQSMTKISNVLNETPYHGNPNVSAFNRAVGDTINFPKAKQLTDIPYAVQQGQNIIRLLPLPHGH